MQHTSFTPDWLLPPGDHSLTMSGLRQSHLVSGEGLGAPGWDRVWRAQLADNLEPFVQQLWLLGVERIFVNGSFVTAKPDPGDLDVIFESAFANYASILIRLMMLEPALPWDLTHRPIDPGSGTPKPMMWHQHRVEIFPSFTEYPNLTGIFENMATNLS
jgi:hypothetical protein